MSRTTGQGVKRPRSEPAASLPITKLSAVSCVLPSSGRTAALLISPATPAGSKQVFLLSPQTAVEEDLHQIFASIGDIQELASIQSDEGRVTRWSVRFTDAASAEAACRLHSAGSSSKNADKTEQRHSVVQERALQRALDVFMTQFDDAEAAVQAAQEAAAGVPDPDGFIKVSRKNSKRTRSGHKAVAGGAAGDLSAAAAASAGMSGVGSRVGATLSANAKRKLKRGSLEKSDFYAFQRKEGKASRLAGLQAAFQADRARVAAAKQKGGRVFKGK